MAGNTRSIARSTRTFNSSLALQIRLLFLDRVCDTVHAKAFNVAIPAILHACRVQQRMDTNRHCGS